ncbi:LytR/AlgR family response regulator transcription factor [Flavihumibacter profundi]|uniref:LytR/AlgR family response regulator transcription factor n=1 Tax=Flavihumibacter profundi TaxID=2716883 RepID=UPI001CC3D296|nr:LytTR family DNA-binding domain-containing protein [Flavihumibacter profundi]MBZ5857585.1 LytTR family transcriptional regulator [Flavihumibacter profundi]
MNTIMQREELLIPFGPGLERVPVPSIQYIESDKRLCKIVTETRSYTIYASIRRFEETLSKGRFLRIHKRYIVSMDFVNFIGKAEIKVAGRVLPVSRKAKEKMQEMFIKYR